VPLLEVECPSDYFLFSANHTHFATTDCFHADAAYNNGKNIDTLFLAYRVTNGPVPEPETYALILVGLTRVASIARKRRPTSLDLCVSMPGGRPP